MKATRDLTRLAVNQAVHDAFAKRAVLNVRPCEPTHARRQASGRVLWSWVAITEPISGVLAVVMPMELAGHVTRTVLGTETTEDSSDQVLGVQRELTNAIAARALAALASVGEQPRLDVPQAGSGAPDVRRGDWMGQTFAVGESWMAIFLQAPALLLKSLDAVGGDAESEPDTAEIIRSDPLTRAVARAVHQLPSDEIEVEEPVAPVRKGRKAVRRRPSGQLPVAAPVKGHRPSGPLRVPRQITPLPEAPSPAGSSTSQRRGVVRTIQGLQAADAPATAMPADAADATRPWYRQTTSHAVDLAIPTAIGNYRVLERVAEGGMGVVLKGEHTTLDRLVAIKLMKPALAGNPAFAARFIREARIAASLEHPNLVTVYDASQEEGQLFMALRWMPGGDLTSLLHRDGPLPERRAVAMFTAMGSVLAYLASKGLLHRDIKPGNILLDSDGTARLGDLGLARERDDAGQAADELDRMGTPSYMSPEQLRGDADLDMRSDLYSLALTLYVALTCRQPLQGADQGQTIANVLNEVPPDPRTFNPAVSEPMARLLRKALDKDRDRRFATANEFIEALAIAEQGGADNELSASGVSWFGKLFAKGALPPRP